MSETVRQIRIFVASPGDVDQERSELARVVEDVRQAIDAIAPGTATVELVRWETHVHPDVGAPQSVINDQIEDYDILVGIMWKRFGTPTETARSGTEEEYRRACERREKSDRPAILFYFSDAPIAVDMSDEEADQLMIVRDFRKEISEKQLFKRYPGPEEFAGIVRRDLLQAVGGILHSGRGSTADAHQARAASTVAVAPELVERVEALAAEYERLRRDMEFSDERTRLLEVLASRMRALAADVYSVLDTLAQSQSPGKRLAAITFLEEIPNPDYLGWLAARFRRRPEPAFAQYHAAVALLAAARLLDERYFDALGAAVTQAKKNLGNRPYAMDRSNLLDEAQATLERRRER